MRHSGSKLPHSDTVAKTALEVRWLATALDENRRARQAAMRHSGSKLPHSDSGALHLDLRAQLDHLVCRQREER
jgi:hypothetical protein